MRNFIVITFFLTHCLHVSAQKLRPDFQTEIGIDAVVPLQYEGFSIVVKTRAFNRFDGKPAWRLLGGYYQEQLYPFDFDFTRADTLFATIYGDNSKYNYFIYSGLEFHRDKRHWRFYVGPEVGFRYSVSHSQSTKTTQLVGTDSLLTTAKYSANIVTQSPHIAFLGGVQFFIIPHVSIGLELNVDSGLEFSQIESINPLTTTRSRHVSFNHRINLIRLLYLSYHFGQREIEVPASGTSN